MASSNFRPNQNVVAMGVSDHGRCRPVRRTIRAFRNAEELRLSGALQNPQKKGQLAEKFVETASLFALRNMVKNSTKKC